MCRRACSSEARVEGEKSRQSSKLRVDSGETLSIRPRYLCKHVPELRLSRISFPFVPRRLYLYRRILAGFSIIASIIRARGRFRFAIFERLHSFISFEVSTSFTRARELCHMYDKFANSFNTCFYAMCRCVMQNLPTFFCN